MNPSTINVLFVCLGNICRSPTAHGVFLTQVKQAGLDQKILVDSCGTGDWHIGHQPDTRSMDEASTRGYDLSVLSARQICIEDFTRFELILVMDKKNLNDVQALMPESFSGELDLFLPYAGIDKPLEVPDPYFGGSDGFQEVLSLIEQASQQLLQRITTEHSL